ncbi:MAG: phage holin family protein [Clostridiales bacterium]|jgi:toxin secretion/phage lysis holin|nr:phage holin family protein [Clostridiales bacterium]
MSRTDLFSLSAAALGGFLGAALGGWDGFLRGLVMFCAMDFLTGLLVSVKDKTYESSKAFWGITRKCLIFALVAVGVAVDTAFIGDGSVVRTAIIFFYASTEGISVLENAGKLGLPVPGKLRDALKQLGKGGGGDVK